MARPIKYHFAALAVGEHLDVPLTGDPAMDGSDYATRRLRRAAQGYAAKYGGQFRVETVRDEGVARCVRVG